MNFNYRNHKIFYKSLKLLFIRIMMIKNNNNNQKKQMNLINNFRSFNLNLQMKLLQKINCKIKNKLKRIINN